MRSRSAWLAASSAALALTGCGGHDRAKTPPPPQIPADVARRLAADADAVADARGCAAHNAALTLRREAIAEISNVPGRYQEELMSAANELAERTVHCAHAQRVRERARMLAAQLRKESR